MGLARLSALFMPLLQALIGIGFLIVLLAGGYQLLAHRISSGSFVMFNTYMGMLVWPMIALGWVVNLMQRGTASLHRINEILKEKPTIQAPPNPPALGDFAGEIEFRGVSVDFGSGPVLNQVDLHIPAASTIAI